MKVLPVMLAVGMLSTPVLSNPSPQANEGDQIPAPRVAYECFYHSSEDTEFIVRHAVILGDHASGLNQGDSLDNVQMATNYFMALNKDDSMQAERSIQCFPLNEHEVDAEPYAYDVELIKFLKPFQTNTPFVPEYTAERQGHVNAAAAILGQLDWLETPCLKNQEATCQFLYLKESRTSNSNGVPRPGSQSIYNFFGSVLVGGLYSLANQWFGAIYGFVPISFTTLGVFMVNGLGGALLFKYWPRKTKTS